MAAGGVGRESQRGKAMRFSKRTGLVLRPFLGTWGGSCCSDVQQPPGTHAGPSSSPPIPPSPLAPLDNARRLYLAPLQIIIARSACGSTAIYTGMRVCCTANHCTTAVYCPLCHWPTRGQESFLNARKRQAYRYPTTCWPCRHCASDYQIPYAPRESSLALPRLTTLQGMTFEQECIPSRC